MNQKSEIRSQRSACSHGSPLPCRPLLFALFAPALAIAGCFVVASSALAAATNLPAPSTYTITVNTNWVIVSPTNPAAFRTANAIPSTNDTADLLASNAAQQVQIDYLLDSSNANQQVSIDALYASNTAQQVTLDGLVTSNAAQETAIAGKVGTNDAAYLAAATGAVTYAGTETYVSNRLVYIGTNAFSGGAEADTLQSVVNRGSTATNMG
jgi:hypothetical protein